VNKDGTVAITYYDFRNNTPAAGLPTDTWAITVDPNGRGGLSNPNNWGNEIRLTPASFDMELAPQSEGRGFFLGDYTGLVAVNGNKFLAVFIVSGTAGPGTSTAVALQFSPGEQGNNAGNNAGGKAGGNPQVVGWNSSFYLPADPALDGSTSWMSRKHRGLWLDQQ
jgi:hypothetical protein